MKDALTLLRRSTSAIVVPSQTSKDTIQRILATRLASCVDELSEDYIGQSKHIHSRTRAVIARTTLEATFRLLASLQSVDLAIGIAYNSAEEDLRRAKLLHGIDPNPSAVAQDVLSSLTEEAAALKTLIAGETPDKLGIFDIAKSAACSHLYRSHYFNLSQFIHSSYSTAPLQSNSAADIISDESILISLCMSSEAIASLFSHTELEEIQFLARNYWQKRKEG